MGIEYELKFRATEEILQQVAAAYPEGHTHFHMQTTYYDTPSGGLSARHYTLRRRMENEISVCTLKTPAGNDSRQELEIKCEDIGEAVSRFAQMGAPEDFLPVTAEGITPICAADFHRTAITLTFSDCTLELALDRGTLIGGGRTVPLCELEIELKEGTPFSVQVFALELVSRYGLVPEKYSKFRRALALYKGESL